MPDFTVARYGTDSSGRPILMTAYMADWWESVVADEYLGFRPTIVQGAFMSRVPGGGASDSAGYHDLGGCLDIRTRDLIREHQRDIIHVVRAHGAAAWRRDQRHGMDPHIHLVLGTDYPLTSGAAAQWESYIAGRDGLASNGPDYEWRPDPLVLTPPEDEVKPEDIDAIAEAVAKRLLDAEKVDREGKVSVRQAINQTRNNAEKAAKK